MKLARKLHSIKKATHARILKSRNSFEEVFAWPAIGTTRGGAEVDICHHIPLGNWLAAFYHARVSVTKRFACRNKGH